MTHLVARMLVQSGVYDEFVKKLTARVAALSMGNGAADGVQLGPLINGGGLSKSERLVGDAVKKVRQSCVDLAHRCGWVPVAAPLDGVTQP